MSWEWSHAPEAYEEWKDELRKKSKAFLNEAYAEWNCNDIIEAQSEVEDVPAVLLCSPHFDGRYEHFIKEAKKWPKDVLVEWVWARAEQLRTTDNGGFNCWVCPEGCHTVGGK